MSDKYTELREALPKKNPEGGLWADIAALLAERDALKEALRHLYHNAHKSGADMGLALDVARAALGEKP